MLFPELDTLVDTFVGDKDRPVILPRLSLFCRTRNGIEDRLLTLDLGEQLDQLLTGKTIVTSHFTDELSHLR